VKFNPGLDYYKILQVHENAHLEVIKRAYRTILGLLQVHPDLGGNSEEAARINEAYAVLSDPETRREYDDARRKQSSHSPGDHHSPGPRSARRPHQPINLHSGSDGTKLTTVQTILLMHRGELRLKKSLLPADHRLSCLRCGFVWTESGGYMAPSACPSCRSRCWSDFRLFVCRHCGRRFSTSSIYRWPYRVFPRCPACRQASWHTGCERHPLRWVINKLNRV
jgi:hypothetical protein